MELVIKHYESNSEALKYARLFEVFITDKNICDYSVNFKILMSHEKIPVLDSDFLSGIMAFAVAATFFWKFEDWDAIIFEYYKNFQHLRPIAVSILESLTREELEEYFPEVITAIATECIENYYSAPRTIH